MRVKVVFNTGDVAIKVFEEDDVVEIRKRIYPIYPYGNYYEDVIRLSGNRLEYYTIRMSWNGTGRDDHGYIELEPDEREDVERMIKSVSSLEDFDKLAEKFIEIGKKKKELVERLWEKLENKLLELIAVEEKVRTLSLTEEELKEKVREFIEYLLGE